MSVTSVSWKFRIDDWVVHLSTGSKGIIRGYETLPGAFSSIHVYKIDWTSDPSPNLKYERLAAERELDFTTMSASELTAIANPAIMRTKSPASQVMTGARAIISISGKVVGILENASIEAMTGDVTADGKVHCQHDLKTYDSGWTKEEFCTKCTYKRTT